MLKKSLIIINVKITYSVSVSLLICPSYSLSFGVSAYVCLSVRLFIFLRSHITISFVNMSAPGTLTKGEGSVQLSSSLK
jgi:hypothetical protein